MYYVLLLLAAASNLSTGATSCAIVIGVLFMIVQGVQRQKWPHFDRKLGYVIVVYMIVQCLIAMMSLAPGKSFGDVWATLYRFLPLFFAVAYIKNEHEVKGILAALVFSTFVNDIYGAYQFINQILYGDYVKIGLIDVVRPKGFNNTATFYASHLLMDIPVMLLAVNRLEGKMRLLAAITAGCSVLMLIASGTRGGWIALVCMIFIGVIGIKNYRKAALKSISILMLVCIAFAIAIPSVSDRVMGIVDMQSESNSSRLSMWRSSLQIIRDYPVFGVGQDQFGKVYNTEYIEETMKGPDFKPEIGYGHPHNNILKMTTEGGAFGLFAFCLLHGYVFWMLWCQYRKEKNLLLSYALIGILIFIGIQVEGLTDTNMNQVPIMREYWLLMGTIFAVGRLSRQQDDKQV